MIVSMHSFDLLVLFHVWPRSVPTDSCSRCEWEEEDGNFELLLILANPMETDVELHLDPGAFNSTAPREASRYAGAAWEDLLGRQNVEVGSRLSKRVFAAIPEGF